MLIDGLTGDQLAATQISAKHIVQMMIITMEIPTASSGNIFQVQLIGNVPAVAHCAAFVILTEEVQVNAQSA